MPIKKTLLCTLLILALAGSGAAIAQLRFFHDWTTSDAVYTVVNVKVDANMMEFYLEGIKQTWVTGNEVAMELGQVEGYQIYINELLDSGDYNLMLVTQFADLAQYDRGRREYAQFEEAWLQALSEQERRQITETYPDMREIVGEYMMRELTFK